MIEVQGQPFFVIHEGAGQPLVFLHGFPLTHDMWDAQRREFRDTYQVLIPDLRGFGRSRCTDDVVTMDQHADDVASLLDACEISAPITLCGLSMGGYIAMAFARRHGDRLGRLVLCDTRSKADTADAAENRRQTAAKVLQDGPRLAADSMLPKLFAPSTNENRPQVIDAIRNMILAGSPPGIAASQRGMAERIDSTPYLAEINVPTLVLVGEHDAISPPQEMQELAQALPHARYEQIAGAGHMSPMEDPKCFNRLLRDWLESTPVP